MQRFTSAQLDAWLVSAAESTKGRAVHLVGIGGCGMSGLAHLLLDLGFAVSGSDLQENAEVRQLRERGAQVFEGHSPDAMREVAPALVIYSSAIRLDNPELELTEQLEIPVVRRAAMLAAMLNRRHGVCVAGMHGKTSTAALLVS